MLLVKWNIFVLPFVTHFIIILKALVNAQHYLLSECLKTIFEKSLIRILWLILVFFIILLLLFILIPL